MINSNTRSVLSNRAISNQARRRAAGFTLIELLIVIAIIAILSAVAYGSYQQSVVKARRKAAQSCALESAQFMERFYTTNLQYDQTLAGGAVALPALACSAAGTSSANFYTIALTVVTPTTYTIQIAPLPAQVDPLCGTMTINQASVKTFTGSGTVSDCW